MKFNIPAEFKNASGVYIIRNSVNSKVYVGGSANFWRRFLNHQNHLANNKHHSLYLQRFVNKHGAKSLSFELLETTELNKDAIIACEQKWIDFYLSYKRENGFNASPTAGSRLGVKLSAEQKAKLSTIAKGRPGIKGRVMSDEQKAKQSAARKGRTISDEQKAKISATLKGRQRPEIKGRVISDEQRAKISAALKGRPGLKGRAFSDEHKAKISAGLKGRAFSDEHKAKISAGLKGRAFSDEHKAKISATAQRRGRTLLPPKIFPMNQFPLDF